MVECLLCMNNAELSPQMPSGKKEKNLRRKKKFLLLNFVQQWFLVLIANTLTVSKFLRFCLKS